MKVDSGSAISLITYLGSGILAITIAWLLPIESVAGRLVAGFFIFWGFMFLGGHLLQRMGK